jgi:hypothetical protein
VLYDGHGEHKDEWDSKTKDLVKDVFFTPQVATALRHYVTIFIPKRQLAALSNLADVPVYTVTKKSSPLLIRANSQGKQIGMSYGSISPEDLAMLLWPAIHETRMDYAEKLAKEGKHTAALRILLQIRKVSKSFVVNQRAMQLTNQIKFQVGEKWAAEGHHQSAQRIFTTVSNSTEDASLRQRSLERIGQTNSTNRPPVNSVTFGVSPNPSVKGRTPAGSVGQPVASITFGVSRGPVIALVSAGSF